MLTLNRLTAWLKTASSVLKTLAVSGWILAPSVGLSASLQDSIGWPDPWPTFMGFKGADIVAPGIANEDAMPYRFFVPAIGDPEDPSYDQTVRLPLVVYLHGSSGNGADNEGQLSPEISHVGAHIWTRSWMPAKYRAIVLAPQVDTSWGKSFLPEASGMMPLVYLAIEELALTYHIDRDRIYLMGNSSGGIGTWAAIFHRPGYFAAAVSSAGTLGNNVADPADLDAIRDRATTLLGHPIWAVHAEGDSTVLVEGDDAAYEVLAGNGMQYERIPGGDHSTSREWTWPLLSNAPNEPLFDWVFAQSLQSQAVPGLSSGGLIVFAVLLGAIGLSHIDS